MPYFTYFKDNYEKIRLSGKRPGTVSSGQLITDVLNLVEGKPASLRLKRFTTKWSILTPGRLWLFAHQIVRNGLGEPYALVYRTPKGDISDSEDWVFVKKTKEEPIPDELQEAGFNNAVMRSKAKRTDLSEFSISDINRSGILDRILQQACRQYLSGDSSSGANVARELVNDYALTGKVDPRRFPYRTDLKCDTYWSVALLEAVFLLYSNRHVEKCFVSSYSPERLRAASISACRTPYFVPARRGARGCPMHQGRAFRNSTAYKRLVRAGGADKVSRGPSVLLSSSMIDSEWQNHNIRTLSQIITTQN